MKKALLLLLLVLQSFVFFGQQSREITGKVLDANDRSPMPGATVIVKGTQAGAVTNIDGIFKYNVNAPDVEKVVLVISYIGYKSQSLRIGAASDFEVLLEEDIKQRLHTPHRIMISTKTKTLHFHA